MDEENRELLINKEAHFSNDETRERLVRRKGATVGSMVGHGGLPENFWRAANSTGGPPYPLNPSSTGTELKFSKVKSINGIFP